VVVVVLLLLRTRTHTPFCCADNVALPAALDVLLCCRAKDYELKDLAKQRKAFFDACVKGDYLGAAAAADDAAKSAEGGRPLPTKPVP
jgi:hypothetical protein